MRRRDERGEPATPRLFGPGELDLRQTGTSRLRALAGRAPRTATERERRKDEDDATMRQLRKWGVELAQCFGLRWSSLQREREGVNGHYGICYEDGAIRIRLRHATTGRLLKQSSLVDTLCHELAHLRYMDHSIRFRRLYQRILDRARELGYYRPGPDGEVRPRQGLMFDDIDCGTAKARK